MKNNNHFRFALKHALIFYIVFIVGLAYHIYFFFNILLFKFYF